MPKPTTVTDVAAWRLTYQPRLSPIELCALLRRLGYRANLTADGEGLRVHQGATPPPERDGGRLPISDELRGEILFWKPSIQRWLRLGRADHAAAAAEEVTPDGADAHPDD